MLLVAVVAEEAVGMAVDADGAAAVGVVVDGTAVEAGAGVMVTVQAIVP